MNFPRRKAAILKNLTYFAAVSTHKVRMEWLDLFVGIRPYRPSW